MSPSGEEESSEAITIGAAFVFLALFSFMKFSLFSWLHRHTAFSRNKSRLDTCSLNLDFSPLFLINDLPGCICYHRWMGHCIFDRPCQGKMSKQRYIVCTLPFLNLPWMWFGSFPSYLSLVILSNSSSSWNSCFKYPKAPHVMSWGENDCMMTVNSPWFALFSFSSFTSTSGGSRSGNSTSFEKGIV